MERQDTTQFLPEPGRGASEAGGGACGCLPEGAPPPSFGWSPCPCRGGNGFSLIELMVVIFIIGLLATVVLINVLPSQDKAMVVKARSDISTLSQAMEMYRLDMSTYPGQGEGLAALKTPPANLSLPQNYRSGGYVKDLPNDPWGHPYQYVVPGPDGQPFDIYSLGSDGQPGGSDLAADIHAGKK